MVIDRLRQVLAEPTARSTFGSTFAPELSYGRHRGLGRPSTRQAAVVALLYTDGGVWYLPLILRPASMHHHAGQVGLPGGCNEPGELAAQCALRELEEELGVCPHRSEAIGQLAPMLVFASDFCVTTIVAVSRERPEFHPNSSEVEELLEIPLSHIFDRSRWETTVIKRGQLEFRAPSLAFQGHCIWGATGLILGELAVAIGGQFQ